MVDVLYKGLHRSNAWQWTTNRVMSQSEIWYWLILWCVHLKVCHRACIEEGFLCQKNSNPERRIESQKTQTQKMYRIFCNIEGYRSIKSQPVNEKWEHLTTNINASDVVIDVSSDASTMIHCSWQQSALPLSQWMVLLYHIFLLARSDLSRLIHRFGHRAGMCSVWC